MSRSSALQRGLRRAYILGAQKKPSKRVRDFHVGDKVEVSLHGGRIVHAVVKAIVTDDKGSRRLQIDFGNETALIYDWQVCS